MPHKEFAKLDDSIKAGISFGITSGVITTLGLIIGLYTGTHQQLVVIGGVMTIAVADSLSDAFGMHLSQESRKGTSEKDVWKATVSTLITKFFFSSSFLIPLFLLEGGLAVAVSVLWGTVLIIVLSYVIAKQEHERTTNVIIHHLGMMIAVMIAAYAVGTIVNNFLI
jgi:vacuolar iron transporter family protein